MMTIFFSSYFANAGVIDLLSGAESQSNPHSSDLCNFIFCIDFWLPIIRANVDIYSWISSTWFNYSQVCQFISHSIFRPFQDGDFSSRQNIADSERVEKSQTIQSDKN